MNHLRRFFLWLPPAVPIALLIGGCATTVSEKPTESEIRAPMSATGSQTAGLSPEMLYDLLLAGIADQRDQPEIALEAFTRAAYQSRDPRIVARATRLALSQEAYRQAVDLARLWASIEPDEPTVNLILASALLELGETERAYRQLTALLDSSTASALGLYQATSDLVARHYTGENPLRFFQRLIDLRPQDANAWFAKALLANRLDNTPQVLLAIDEALKLRSDWVQAALIKLAVLADSNRDRELHIFAESFSRDHPQALQFRLQYARLLFESGNNQAALDQFRAILSYDPDNTDALYAAALIGLDAEEFKLARELLERHLELDPDHDQTRLYLADAALGSRDYDEAKRQLGAVTDPELQFSSQLKLGEVIAKADGLEAAMAYLQGIIPADDEQLLESFSLQDQLLREADRLDEARQLLDQALVQLPDHPDLLYSRGLLAAQLNQLDSHEQDLRRLIELEPDNAHAYNALGYTLADLTNRLDEAEQLVQEALKLRPDDPFILDSMGWVYYRQGKTELAIDYLRRAIRIREDPEIAAHLGEALWVAGNREEAQKIWSRALSLHPDHELLQSTISRLRAEDV